jgi:putative two-component system response regulator
MAKILIVDDNEQNCELMRDVVSTWGHDVHKVFQGIATIDFALRHQPDLILLDVMLPGMNGFEVCRELKRNPKTDNIYIIMLTALDDVQDRIRGFKVGADSFISKPANYNELKYIIASKVKRKQMIDGMETQQQVCESFLALMKAQNSELYHQALERARICEKAGWLLALSEEQQNRLLIAACLYDIGSLAQGGGGCENRSAGEAVIKSLKMGEWLKFFINHHHEKVNSQELADLSTTEREIAPALQVLETVIRYQELCRDRENKDKELSVLQAEAQRGEWDPKVVAALLQLRQDETFIQELNAGQ